MTIKQILVIDNEPYIREVTQICLKTIAGWKAILAGSGSEGIVKAETEQPDAILLDVVRNPIAKALPCTHKSIADSFFKNLVLWNLDFSLTVLNNLELLRTDAVREIEVGQGFQNLCSQILDLCVQVRNNSIPQTLFVANPPNHCSIPTESHLNRGDLQQNR